MRLVWPLMVRRVQGHSMVPTLPPGTVIFGWRWFTRLHPNRVVVFCRADREIVKRIQYIENDSLFVIGDHPETSTDSRQYGTINQETVTAVVMWPRTGGTSAGSFNSLRQNGN